MDLSDLMAFRQGVRDAPEQPNGMLSFGPREANKLLLQHIAESQGVQPVLVANRRPVQGRIQESQTYPPMACYAAVQKFL